MSDELLIGITNKTSYQAIANAIRAKGGSANYTPSEMAAAILDLPSGGDVTIPKLYSSTIMVKITWVGDSTGDIFYIPVLYNTLDYPPFSVAEANDGTLGQLNWLGRILKAQGSAFALHSGLYSGGSPIYEHNNSNNAVLMIKVDNREEAYSRFEDQTGLFYWIEEKNGYTIPYFLSGEVEYDVFSGGYSVKMRELHLQEIDPGSFISLIPTAVSDLETFG